jgi:hypothetical protein
MFSFTVERQDAEAIRSLLDTFPVTYTVRRRWIFWRRFTVDGMDPDAVRMALDEAHWLKSSLWFGGLERKPLEPEPERPAGLAVQPDITKGVPQVHAPHVLIPAHGLFAGDVEVDQAAQGD